MRRSKAQAPSLTSVRHIFSSIIWPRRWLLLLGLGLITINRLAGLVLPGTTKFLIDDVIVNSDRNMLRLLLLAVGGAVTVQAISSFALTRLLSVEAQHLIAELRAQVQRHIIHLPMGYHDDNKSGALVSRIMNDVEGVRNLVGTGLVLLVGGLITSVVALVLLIQINARMTVMAVVPLMVFSGIALKAFSYIRPIFRVRGEIYADVTGRLTESLGGVRVIKGFNAESREISVFRAGVDRIFDNVKKTLTAQATVTSASTLLLGVASVGIMSFGGGMMMDGQMTVGEFFAYTLYLGFLVAPIVQMSAIGTQLTESFAGLDRMEEVLEQVRETDNPDRTITLERIHGEFVFEDVVFAYDETTPVVRGVSFTAGHGSTTALVGSSGSGKTTIASLAASFLTPQSGRITVDGHDLSCVTLDSYRSQLGVVLQDEFLFEGTIRENILFSFPDATGEQLLDAVRGAHVGEFADRFEDGLDTVIGERGVKLSGGQRQRVAIARAILADPRVLVLDEATSSLDTESEAFIQESLGRLLKDRTTFVIAHRLSTIRRADQILVIEAGEIVERGTHDDLIGKKGRYYELYTYQARI
jgi:ABC-type multidrug transport system fused ATPase/permease subunit